MPALGRQGLPLHVMMRSLGFSNVSGSLTLKVIQQFVSLLQDLETKTMERKLLESVRYLR